MIRVVLPAHLRTLAQVPDDVQLEIAGQVTAAAILDALESKHLVLRGTIRDQTSLKRRALVRFFVCGEDISHEPPETPLPDAVAQGAEPFVIIGAMAGG